MDLVTETDQAVEEMVKSTILEKYKDHKCFLMKIMTDLGLSEKRHILQVKRVSWTIHQPGLSIQSMVNTSVILKIYLGTTNFVHGVPYMAISIGFTVSRRPTIGIVLNPFTGQLYSGIDSQGSYLTTLSSDLSQTLSTTKLPIYPPRPLELRSSAIAIEFGSDRSGPNFEVKLSTFRNLASENGGMVHALRAYGSAALNLCSVASGYIDAYWEGGVWEWDVCAGWLILKEAGGSIFDGNPRDVAKDPAKALEDPDLCGRVYLGVRGARSPEEVKTWVEGFWNLMEGRLEYGR